MKDHPPRTIVAVKEVKLALVTYTDEIGQPNTQLALVGDENVHLLNSRNLGISDVTTQGLASKWLREGILKKIEEK